LTGRNSKWQCLRNDLYCVGWGAKLHSLTHSLQLCGGFSKKLCKSVTKYRQGVGYFEDKDDSL